MSREEKTDCISAMYVANQRGENLLSTITSRPNIWRESRFRAEVVKKCSGPGKHLRITNQDPSDLKKDQPLDKRWTTTTKFPN